MRVRKFAIGAIVCFAGAAAADEAAPLRERAVQVQTAEAPVPSRHPACADRAASDNPYATSAAPQEPEARRLEQQDAAIGLPSRDDAHGIAMPGLTPQIVFQVQMLEVSLTKLRDLGADTEWFAGGEVSATSLRRLLQTHVPPTGQAPDDPTVADDLDEGRRWVQYLQRRNLAKVLAEPTIATVVGRRASLRIGGRPPTPKSDREGAATACWQGVELELEALAADDEQISLDMTLKVSVPLDPRANAASGDPRLDPCVRELHAKLALPLGTSTLLTGMVEQRTESRQAAAGGIEEVLIDVGQLVVVTPTLIGSSQTPPRSERRAAPVAAPK